MLWFEILYDFFSHKNCCGQQADSSRFVQVFKLLLIASARQMEVTTLITLYLLV